MKFFKSLFTTMMSVILLTTAIPSFAQANQVDDVESSMKNIMDNFHYRMIVEWDQKDEEFRKFAVDELNQSISLLRETGDIDADLVQFFQNESMDQFKDVPRNSLEAAFSYINRNYQQGASFHPIQDRYRALGIVIIGSCTIILIASLVQLFPITISN